MKRIRLCYIVASLALLSVVLILWIKFKDSAIEEPRVVEFQKHNLKIEEIKIPQAKEPIWFVKTKNPTVAIFISFKNEGIRNFKAKPGIMKLIFSLLPYGAGKYNATELKKVFNANSINFSMDVGQDSSSISLYMVPEKFQLAISLLNDILIHAHLPEDKLEVIKRDLKQNVSQALVYPESIAEEAMRKLIYQPDHPYYWTHDEILHNIDKYTRNDLVDLYNKLFDPRNAQVIIAGSISEAEVKVVFEKLFSELKKHKSNLFENTEQSTEQFKAGEIVHINHDSPQTIVLFCHPGVKSTSKEIFLRFGG
jgi:zinc protease